MFLKQKFSVILAFISLLALFFFFFYLRVYQQQVKSAETTNKEKVVENNSDDEEINLLQEPITILLVGLDSRRSDPKARCDAIHLLTFSPPEEKIVITSVPRNARVDLPEVASESAYLANVCEKKGIEAGIGEIIRISNLRPDHIIKVNFSQTLGILRFLGLPTTPTLQFLRDRRSYLKGGYQRSHNQALFLKDMILDHSQRVANLATPIKKVLFKIPDTGSLDFETTDSILNWVVKSKIFQKPEKIELVTKPTPWYKIIDIHFSPSDYPSEDSWQNDEEFQAYQSEFKSYLEALVKQGDKYLENGQKQAIYQLLKTPFSQQLWLQLEKEEERNQLHFDLLRLYVFSLEDKDEACLLVEDFIAEMEATEKEELKNKAQELLASDC